MDIATLYTCFQECGEVTTDSRHCPEGSLFIALKGASFNGNAFAAKALEQGCRYAVIDEADYADVDNSRLLLVDDCLKTLQQLANYHRRQLGTRIIGVTGTNGKTTTKELIASVLSEKYNVLYTQGNYNNHIGVPLTLLQLTKEHDLAVIEMGANHPGEIDTLVHIAEPNYGIITNVGKAHLEGFGSFQGVIRTKGELYDFLRNKSGSVVFIQNENPYLNKIVGDLKTVSYGKSEGLYVSGHVTSCKPFLAYEWSADGKMYEVQTHLIGSYNLDNALAATAIGRYFEVSEEQICHALSTYEPHNNRSQLTQTSDNQLIVDAYNANPTSMMAALENFKMIEAPHKMAILGDMKELGAGSKDEHQKIVDFLRTCPFERVILVGTEFESTDAASSLMTTNVDSETARVTFEMYADTASLTEVLKNEKPTDKLILIKGSNSMKLAALQYIL